MKRLLSVKGFGEGRIQTLVSNAGGGNRFLEILKNGDVAALSSLERISQRSAVDLILAYRGEDTSILLRTDGSRSIYDSIIERMRSYMSTSPARDRISLLMPCGNLEEKMEDAARVHGYRELVGSMDRSKVFSLLQSLEKWLKPVRSARKLDYILVVEDEEANSVVSERRMDRRCLVLSPEEVDPSLEGEMVFVYNTRELDETLLPISGAVRFDSPPARIIPELVLDRYGGREAEIDSLIELEKLFGREGVAADVRDLLEKFNGIASGPGQIEDVRGSIDQIREEVEGSLKEKIENLTLSGSDTLSLLSSDEPPALREIYREHSKMAADLVYSSTGQKRDLFVMGYPVIVDEEALERMVSEIESQNRSERFSRKQDLAAKLDTLWADLEKEIAWGFDLDFRFGLGCFVADHDLNPFKKVDGWLGIHKACHLMIRSREDRQLVDYHLGEVPGYAGTMFPFRELSFSRTSLLTGANSGGKTTLLETLSQVLIMARMGLPVPADKAFIPDIENLFYYRPRRRLDAGGLEGFLKELLPLVLKVDQRSMVLADELEAMTELEAASRMIGVFVEELMKREAYSVVVTHMASEITRFVDCRVDGIEARGLDEGHELVVDRSPMIGKHARSTPELILRKLKARSSGREREIYSRVLSHFDE
jgi:hypothetical protein